MHNYLYRSGYHDLQKAENQELHRTSNSTRRGNHEKKMNAHIDCNEILAQPFLAFAHAVSAFIEFDLVACRSVLY